MSNGQQTRDVDMRVIIVDCLPTVESYCPVTLTPEFSNKNYTVVETKPNALDSTKTDVRTRSSNGVYEMYKEFIEDGLQRVYITLLTTDYSSITVRIGEENFAVKKVHYVNTSLVPLYRLLEGNLSVTYVDASEWDMSQVNAFSSTFKNCKGLETIVGIENWDMSNVTYMQSTFYNCSKLTNLDLSNWRLNSLIELSKTFYGCTSLTSIGNIKRWNARKVENIIAPFGDTKIEYLDVEDWDMSSVIKLSIFEDMECLTSTGDITKWDVSNVEWMEGFAAYCLELEEIDVTGWNVRKLKNFECAFARCVKLKKIIGLETWKPESLETMREAFAFNHSLESVNLTNWGNYTNNIETFQFTFQECYNLKSVDVSGLVTNKTEDLWGVFVDCYQLEYIYGLDTWDTSCVTDFTLLFSNCLHLKDLSGIRNWNTSRATCTDSTFMNCISDGYIDISKWDMSNVECVEGIFGMIDYNDETFYKYFPDINTLTATTVNLSGLTFNFKPSFHTFKMFIADPNYEFITNIYLCDMTYLDVNKIINELGDRTENTPGALYINNVYGMHLIDYEQAHNLNWKFYIKNEDTDEDTEVNNFEPPVAESIKVLEYVVPTSEANVYPTFNEGFDNFIIESSLSEDESLTTVRILHTMPLLTISFENSPIQELLYMDTSQMRILSNTFSDCPNLIKVNCNDWDLRKVVRMENVFSSCPNLTYVDVSNWDVSNVKHMRNVFYDLGLKSLDVSAWKLDNLSYYDCLIDETYDLEYLNISNIDLSYIQRNNGERFVGYYSSSYVKTVDFTNLNLRGIENLDWFFDCFECVETLIGIETLDLSDAESLEGFFAYCYEYPAECLDCSNWNVSSKCKTLEMMFQDVEKVKSINVSNWDVSNVETLHCTFENMYHCKEIIGLETWNTKNVRDMASTFAGNMNLKSFKNIKRWNTSKVELIGYAFSNCVSAEEFDFSRWDLSSLYDANSIFGRNWSNEEIMPDLEPENINLPTSITVAMSKLEKLWAMDESTLLGCDNYVIDTIYILDSDLECINLIIRYGLVDRTGMTPGTLHISRTVNESELNFEEAERQNWQINYSAGYPNNDGDDDDNNNNDIITFAIMHNNKQVLLYFKDKKLI